jgi:hypothetical protein
MMLELVGYDHPLVVVSLFKIYLPVFGIGFTLYSIVNRYFTLSNLDDYTP